MAWLPLFVLTMIVALPASKVIFRQVKVWVLRAQWNRLAEELGLTIAKQAPEVELSGILEGVSIELRESVTYRRKEKPLYLSVARACLTTVAEPAAAYRVSNELRAPLEPATLGPVDVVDGWIERKRDAHISPKEAKGILAALVAVARAMAADLAPGRL